MKKITLTVLSVLFATSVFVYAKKTAPLKIAESAEQIDIIRPGDLPSTKGPKSSFTGEVRVDRIFPGAIRLKFPVESLRLSRAPGRRGIPTRKDRLL